MKIAIKANPNRGKEIISLLESLGGINDNNWKGDGNVGIYYIDENNIIRYNYKPIDYKVYTLEEFEKEFPFKIGDEVIFSVTNGWLSGKITGLTYVEDQLKYEVDNRIAGYCYIEPHKLSLYPMKKERNITLTLEKAKEWYRKGGELKEIALQAFSEKELNPLPRSWKEFAANNARMGYYISSDGKPLMCASSGELSSPHVCPSKKSAEAHLAMIQLEQLRDCYNNNSDAWGWSYSIIKRNGVPELVRGCDHDTFLRFQNETIAKEFLKNFKDLIEKAGDLI
jgi:hypothetical protein